MTFGTDIHGANRMDTNDQQVKTFMYAVLTHLFECFNKEFVAFMVPKQCTVKTLCPDFSDTIIG